MPTMIAQGRRKMFCVGVAHSNTYVGPPPDDIVSILCIYAIIIVQKVPRCGSLILLVKYVVTI